MYHNPPFEVILLRPHVAFLLYIKHTTKCFWKYVTLSVQASMYNWIHAVQAGRNYMNTK